MAECLLCGSSHSVDYFPETGYYDIVRCLACGLVFVRDLPTREDLSVFYSSSSVHDPVIANRREINRWHNSYLKRLNSFCSKGSLLDVGCSFGFFLESAREQGWSVKGVEVAHYPAKHAIKELGLEVFEGDIFEASFAGEQFDAITAWHVLEHTTNPAHILMEMKRIMRADGVLGLAVPNISSAAARMGGPRWEWLGPPSHLFYFSPETLRGLLQKVGFRVLYIGTCQGRSTPLLYWAWDTCIFGTRLNVVGRPLIELLSEVANGGNSATRIDKSFGEAATDPVIGARESLLQKLRAAARGLEPLSIPAQWIADRLGMGAEIVAFARKIS